MIDNGRLDIDENGKTQIEKTCRAHTGSRSGERESHTNMCRKNAWQKLTKKGIDAKQILAGQGKVKLSHATRILIVCHIQGKLSLFKVDANEWGKPSLEHTQRHAGAGECSFSS